MRTTVDIPDAIYRRVKATPLGKGCTEKEMVLRGIENRLKARKRHRSQVLSH